MYKFRAFKVEPVNKLEKPGKEKAKIHKHNNKKVTYGVRNKVFMRNLLSIEFDI